eukprot:TRINITY_DN939_c1_g1_i1.p1 TRINITY_DN939_c1_g1~~TRINITY_DN939_c1_g1_i1.p1  ORF type:complete len:278 (+),score=63.98 TRINITY_DN939_c1_g1_i1:51-884(+)
MARLLAVLPVAAAAAGGWEPFQCVFGSEKPKDIQTGGSLCCVARDSNAPTTGSQYRLDSVGFRLAADPGDGCSAQGCWHVRVRCDGSTAYRAPPSGASCADRGADVAEQGTGATFRCSDSFSVCLNSDDPSLWPAEYCAVVQNLTFEVLGKGTAGPPSALDIWGIPVALLSVVLFSLFVVYRVMVECVPGAVSRVRCPLIVFGVLAALFVALFPRIVVAEWRAELELFPVLLVALIGFVLVEVYLFKIQPRPLASEVRDYEAIGDFPAPSAPPLEDR